MRILPALFCLIPCLCLVSATVGCNKDGARTDLEDFAQRIKKLPAAAATDTLYGLVDAPAPQGAFARFHLGNLFYAQATERAKSHGWNDEQTAAWLDSAQTWLSAAIAADSTMVEAYINLGSLWDDRAEMMAERQERLVRIGNARSLFLQALALDPQNEMARVNLGTLHRRQGNLEAAMSEYLAVLEQNPRSALARYNLALLFATQQVYKEALREFELAAKHDPHGDIGQRSRDNIQIIKNLMAAD